MPETNEPSALATTLNALGSAADGIAPVFPGVGAVIARSIGALLKMGGAIASTGKDVPATITRLMNEVPLLADVKAAWDAQISAKPHRTSPPSK